MFEHSSPGVYSAEYDRATQVKVVTGGAVTLCVPLPRGKVGKNLSLYGTTDVETYLGKPTGIYKDYLNYIKLLATKARVVNVTRVALNTAFAGVYLTTFSNFCTTRPLGSTLVDPDQAPMYDKDIMLICASSEGEWANDLYITAEPDLRDVEGVRFKIKVYVGNNKTPSETHVCTTFYKVTDEGNQLFVEDVINESSKYIRVKMNPNHYKLATDAKAFVVNAICGGPYDPNNPTVPSGQLTGGSDGDLIDVHNSDVSIRDNSVAAVIEAWNGYADWEKVYTGVLCDAGMSDPAIIQALDSLSQSRQDSISCASLPAALQDRDDAVAFRRGLKKYNGSYLNLSSSWTAMASSDVKARDMVNQRDFWVPASVCLAYTMMNTDQIAQWLAPAGLNRGGLPFAIDVRHRYRVDDRDVLTDNQINPIAVFEGQGVYVWGADTMYAVKSPFNDIGVRRLLSMLHAVVRINQLPAVFEPNDDILRQNQRESLDAVLSPIKAGRGLDWYSIVCDETNNPPEVEANGDLLIDVFLDPTRYTKRIHICATVPRVGEIEFALQLIDKQAA